METKIRLIDSNLFRLLLFVVIPLIVLIYCALRPKSYYTGIVIMIGIYIILCASLNLVNGFSGMFSMGHAAFMAIGSSTGTYVQYVPTRGKSLSFCCLAERKAFFLPSANSSKISGSSFLMSISTLFLSSLSLDRSRNCELERLNHTANRTARPLALTSSNCLFRPHGEFSRCDAYLFE